MMSASKVQISKMIYPPNTTPLDASDKKTPDNVKPVYERLTEKLQENFHVSYLIVMKPDAQTTSDVKI